jgi:FMN phosphatase YigB (HAD superfamily)
LRRVRAVLFDLGGVLTSDPWQSLLLTPGAGIADQLGLDRYEVERVGELLWSRYSLDVHPEDDYWRAFAECLSTKIPASVVERAELETLRTNTSASATFEMLDQKRVPWGYVTDNTSFWLPKQIRQLDGRVPVGPDLAYYSFDRGLSKTSTPTGLFELAAASLDPRTTLVVDDREKNIDRASLVGFRTLQYSMRGNQNLANAIAPRLEAPRLD